MKKDNRIKEYEPIFLHKPTREQLRKAIESIEEMHKIVKDMNIPYMSAEQIAELLKDRDMNEK